MKYYKHCQQCLYVLPETASKSLNTLMENLYSEIGRRMRSVRKSLRMTQARLAEAAGIDPSFYGQIERGMNIPSLKTFLSISRALGVEPADLLPGRHKGDSLLYERTLQRLVKGLDPKRKRLVIGLVSDMVGRLKR